LFDGEGRIFTDETIVVEADCCGGRHRA